jgi:hypothetical protein
VNLTCKKDDEASTAAQKVKNQKRKRGGITEYCSSDDVPLGELDMPVQIITKRTRSQKL